MVSHDKKYGPRESCPHCQRARHSPAEYLRALDRAATPGPWGFRAYHGPYYDGSMGMLWGFQEWGTDKKGEPAHWHDNIYSPDGTLIAALRNLLPLLADVVQWADKLLGKGIITDLIGKTYSAEPEYLAALKAALDRLTAAVAEVEGKP